MITYWSLLVIHFWDAVTPRSSLRIYAGSHKLCLLSLTKKILLVIQRRNLVSELDELLSSARRVVTCSWPELREFLSEKVDSWRRQDEVQNISSRRTIFTPCLEIRLVRLIHTSHASAFQYELSELNDSALSISWRIANIELGVNQHFELAW